MTLINPMNTDLYIETNTYLVVLRKQSLGLPADL